MTQTLFLMVTVCSLSHFCFSQPTYWGTSVGISIRTNLLTDNPAEQEIRLVYATTPTDSSEWYTLAGFDYSFKRWAPVLTLQHGRNVSLNDNLNLRPHIGIGGIKFGKPSNGPLSVFNVYFGLCVESQIIHSTIVGIGYEQRFFVPYSLQADQPDISVFARFRI